MKIPASKSLNSLQLLQQELYTFDCQGGLEELCKDVKCENTSTGIFEDSFDSDASSDSEEWMENHILKENQLRKQEKIGKFTEDNSEISSMKNLKNFIILHVYIYSHLKSFLIWCERNL